MIFQFFQINSFPRIKIICLVLWLSPVNAGLEDLEIGLEVPHVDVVFADGGRFEKLLFSISVFFGKGVVWFI